MYVIEISSGIKHGHHDGAAVLLRDRYLIAAAEERFTLAKHVRGELPRGAIEFCLKQARHQHAQGLLDKFAKLLRPCGINYELDPELDKRSRDAEIFTSDFSTLHREDGGDFGAAAAARPTARSAADQHRGERPEAARHQPG